MATEPIAPAQAEEMKAQLQATPSHPEVMEAQLQTTSLNKGSPLPEAVLTTSRLLLRPMHPQDATSMQLHASPPSITKYMSLAFAYPYTLEHANTWININLKDSLPNYVIAEISDPSIAIGGIGLKPGADVESHTAEIGYWIGEPFAGKGYITEALQGLTDWVFMSENIEERGKYKRLYAGCFSGNVASMRCLEKCGYRKEGVLKGHVEKWGDVYDLHMFGLTKKDWQEEKNRNSVIR